MKIIDKAVTPDGTKIELHDLSGKHKLPDYNGMTINFCTIAKNTFPEGNGWYSQKGEEFSSCVYSWGDYTKDMLKNDYEALKNGTKTLADLKEHFWNHQRDCFALGLKAMSALDEVLKEYDEKPQEREKPQRKRRGR